MDLRVDIIAISRMTYQLAMAPEKSADFLPRRKSAPRKCWSACRRCLYRRCQRAEATGGYPHHVNAYFEQIRQMVKVAGTEAGRNPPHEG